MHRSHRVEATSSDELVAPRPGGPPPIDNADESTVLDLVELPDNEPTTIWPLAGVPDARRWIGKYELRDKLARGAFGVVFLARDPSLDRDVAIKVLRPNHLTNQVIVQRFLHEARATARIAHPGIVTIHDCGQIETNLGVTAFIAMELLDGDSLAARLARVRRLDPADAVEIARQLASALEAAHRADVLHRDLKPDNIYLVADPATPAGERVKVFDFGLAKLGDRAHTQLDTVFGTPHYMSPEQCRSTAQVDHRSDIYALGCILFELVTGGPPFDGEIRAVIEHHQRVVAPRAAALVPDLAPELDDLIAAMLAKDPMARPQTMGAVQRALLSIGMPTAPSQPVLPRAASQPIVAPPPSFAPPPILVEPPGLAAALEPGPASGVLLVPPTGARPSGTGDAGARPVAPRRSRALLYAAFCLLVIAAAIALALITDG